MFISPHVALLAKSLDTPEVGRIVARFNLEVNFLINEVADDIAVPINSMTTALNMKTQLLKFPLKKPDMTWLEAYVVENMHTFPRLDLDKKIVKSYLMDGPFPRKEGKVDFLLGIVDSMRLLKGKPTFISNSFALIPAVYGYVPSGGQSAETLNNSRITCSTSLDSYLMSAESLTEAMEKMWEMDKLPMDDFPSSLTKDEVIAVEKIKDTMKLHKDCQQFITGLLWRKEPDLFNNFASARTRPESLFKKVK